MFMVTSVREDAGRGDFAVLDYVRWTPHRQAPRSAFKKLPQCAAPPAGGAKASAPAHCSTCQSAKPTN